MPHSPKTYPAWQGAPSLADTGKNRGREAAGDPWGFPPRQPALRVRQASVQAVRYKWSARGAPGTECFLRAPFISTLLMKVKVTLFYSTAD